MIKKAKALGVALEADTKSGCFEDKDAMASDEYGFSFTVTQQVSYGIFFQWNNDNFYLYTGLFDRRNERDIETARSIKNQMKRDKLKSEDPVSTWYIWIKTQDSSTLRYTSFKATSETKNASSEEWRQWARDNSEAFFEDYKKLSQLVLSKPEDGVLAED
jgi:hypothetical protein